MKYIRFSGLVALAVVALLAVAGSSASATVICQRSGETEHCAEPYPAGTEGDASIEDTMKLTSFGITLDTCSESTVTGTSVNVGSATTTVSSTLTSLTFGNCTVTTMTTSPGTGELHHIAGTDNGTVTTSGTTVTVNFAGSDCEFATSNTDMGTATGGNPGTMDLNATIPEVSNRSGCPASGSLSGHYKATSPTAAWVSAS